MKIDYITNKVVFTPSNNTHNVDTGFITDLSNYTMVSHLSNSMRVAVLDDLKSWISNMIRVSHIYAARVEDEFTVDKVPLFDLSNYASASGDVFFHDHLDWRPNVATALLSFDDQAVNKDKDFHIVLNFFADNLKEASHTSTMNLDSGGVYLKNSIMNVDYGYLDSSIYKTASYFSRTETNSYWGFGTLRRLAADIIIAGLSNKERVFDLFIAPIALSYINRVSQ